MTRRIARAVALVALYVVLDLLEAAAYLAGVALATVALSLVLPLPVAFAAALLAVTIPFAYIHARRAGRIHRDF